MRKGKGSTSVNLLQILLGISLLLCISSPRAAPNNGIGLFIGPIYRTQPNNGLQNGSGWGLGVDAQYSFNAHWSLNPYLEMSNQIARENAEFLFSGHTYFREISGSMGLQARYWTSDFFLGAQYLLQSTHYGFNDYTQADYWGTGWGAAAGWESQNHWSITVQWDGYSHLGYSPFGQHYLDSMRRILIGYRWY